MKEKREIKRRSSSSDSHLRDEGRHGGRRGEVRALDGVCHADVAAFGAGDVALDVEQVPLRVDLEELFSRVLLLLSLLGVEVREVSGLYASQPIVAHELSQSMHSLHAYHAPRAPGP